LAIVKKLSPELWQIDLPFQGEHEVISPYLISGKDELALIDPGPENVSDHLFASIREAGFAPGDITHILLTHIHLDHAGGVGSILPQMPKARVFVNEKGAPHLIDTTKLITSATRIYGDNMQNLWGKIENVPADRIQAIAGGEILQIAGRRLEVHYTPGHASHHVVFFDVHAGELFVGDAAGVRLPNVSYVRPPTPPPDFNLEEWSSTIDLLKKLHPDILYLSHFGGSDEPDKHLDNLRENLITWGDYVIKALQDGKSVTEISTLLKTRTEPDIQQRAKGDPQIVKRYDLTSSYEMTVQGYVRYWKKYHPERL
jgi:glyoxylase-like metal-dependent hydrolase (beta-lactamase superfamily II)